MKNNFFSLALVIFLLVFGLVFISCSTGMNNDNTEITLSGTINVTYNGAPVPFIDIYLHDEEWEWYDYVSLSSQGPNTMWSIKLESFQVPTEIHFTVEGYDAHEESEDRELLFDFEDIIDVITVFDKDIKNIPINLGNLEYYTLSGTITVTYNTEPVPYIGLYLFNEDHSLNQYLHLSSEGPNTPWSVIMGPFSGPTEIYFHIAGYENEDDEEFLFNKDDEDIDYGITVNGEDYDGISIVEHYTS